MTTRTASKHPRTMRAAVLTAPGLLEVQEVPLPEPGPGEIRVRVEGCGVCASNLPPWQGRDWFQYPMAPGALGHEAWGVVDAGSGEWSEGRRVAMLSCHAYAEYDVAAASAVVALPASLDDLPFPAEPLGCAMNIWARCGVAAGQTVAIVGIGFLGALLCEMAVRAGATVIAIGRRQSALDDSRAAHTLLMDDHGRIIEAVRELTGGRFCDVVIEAAGKQWPLDLAGELTAERGRLVVAGYHQDGPRQVNMQLWNWRGLDVINAHERDPAVYLRGMERAVAAVNSGTLNPGPLLTHRFSFDHLAEALEMTHSRPPGFMKALVIL